MPCYISCALVISVLGIVGEGHYSTQCKDTEKSQDKHDKKPPHVVVENNVYKIWQKELEMGRISHVMNATGALATGSRQSCPLYFIRPGDSGPCHFHATPTQFQYNPCGVQHLLLCLGETFQVHRGPHRTSPTPSYTAQSRRL